MSSSIIRTRPGLGIDRIWRAPDSHPFFPAAVAHDRFYDYMRSGLATYLTSAPADWEFLDGCVLIAKNRRSLWLKTQAYTFYGLCRTFGSVRWKATDVHPLPEPKPVGRICGLDYMSVCVDTSFPSGHIELHRIKPWLIFRREMITRRAWEAADECGRMRRLRFAAATEGSFDQSIQFRYVVSEDVVEKIARWLVPVNAA